MATENAANPASDAADSGPAASSEAEKIPEFRSARTAEDLFDLLLRRIAAELKRGPDGHRTLLRMLSEFEEDEQLQALIRESGEPSWDRWMFRAMSFLVQHQRQAIDMLETTFTEAAADTKWFHQLSPETFDLLSRYWELVPFMVDTARVARLRVLLDRVLALDKSRLPPAVDNYREDLQELRRLWSDPLTPEEAPRFLTDPAVSIDDRIFAMLRTPAESLRGIDLVPLLTPGIRADDEAVLFFLLQVEFSAGDVARLDEAMYESLASESHGVFSVDTYLEGTRPNLDWPTRKAFYEEGIRRGGNIRKSLIRSVGFEPLVTRRFLDEILAIPGLTDLDKLNVRIALADMDEDE